MPEIEFTTIDASAAITSAVSIVLIIVVAWVAYAVISRATRRAVEAHLPRVRAESHHEVRARAATISGAVNQALKVVIVLIALIAVLGQVNIEIAPMLAGVGVIGLALGFAAQGIVRDYIHGMFILMEDWYRVGEVVTIDGESGAVEDLSMRKTVLRTGDGTRVIIPNSSITKASNMTRDWARVSLNVSVAYGTDLDRAFAAINRIGELMKADAVWGVDLITTPSAVRVNNLGDSSIDIAVSADTKPARQWALAGEFRKRLLAAFHAEGIETPTPHMMVHLDNGEGGPRADRTLVG